MAKGIKPPREGFQIPWREGSFWWGVREAVLALVPRSGFGDKNSSFVRKCSQEKDFQELGGIGAGKGRRSHKCVMLSKVVQRVTWAESHRGFLEECRSCFRVVLAKGRENRGIYPPTPVTS